MDLKYFHLKVLPNAGVPSHQAMNWYQAAGQQALGNRPAKVGERRSAIRAHEPPPCSVLGSSYPAHPVMTIFQWVAMETAWGKVWACVWAEVHAGKKLPSCLLGCGNLERNSARLHIKKGWGPPT